MNKPIAPIKEMSFGCIVLHNNNYLITTLIEGGGSKYIEIRLDSADLKLFPRDKNMTIEIENGDDSEKNNIDIIQIKDIASLIMCPELHNRDLAILILNCFYPSNQPKKYYIGLSPGIVICINNKIPIFCPENMLLDPQEYPPTYWH